MIMVTSSNIASSLWEARQILKRLALPVSIHPSFTMRPQPKYASTIDEFDDAVMAGLDESPTTEVLIKPHMNGGGGSGGQHDNG